MRDPADFESYRTAIRDAASATALDSEHERRVRAETFWVEAIHAMIVRNGCPCVSGGDDCFLKLHKETRREKFQGSDLSYENFLEILEEALALALATISPRDSA